MILVDTNVLLDVAQDDPVWAEWSAAELEKASRQDDLCINPVIYAELSIGYGRIEELEAVLAACRLGVVELPREALFLAGKAFLNYRRQRGARTGVLPDFFIGAHASVAGWSLLTRDATRYRTCFPKLTLIAPVP